MSPDADIFLFDELDICSMASCLELHCLACGSQYMQFFLQKILTPHA